MTKTFAQLGVPNSIVTALAERGIIEPFQIQAATIADALAGRDVCGRAPTGSGKTLAFGIPLVVSVGRAEPKRPRALVLAPTRELAEQINSDLRTFAGDVRIGVVYGGVGYQPQVNSLRRGVDILVACPGRLEDLIEQGFVSLADVDRVVLDEADRMADMGFMPSVRRLLDQTSNDRQTVLFSATLDGDIAKLTRDYQRDPVRHEVGESTPDITAATHLFWNAARADRVGITATAVEAAWPAIIFCRTRHGSDRVAKQLARAGIDAAAIHGGRSQGQRTRALDDFSKGRVQALVATDVASRGIHVDGVACVVHFDPPEDHKAYVHRSGRTARAGESGVVVSLVQPEQKRELKKIQREIGLDQPFTDPDATAVSEAGPTTPRRAPQPRTASHEGGRSDRGGSSNGRQGGAPRNRNGQKRRDGGAPRSNGDRDGQRGDSRRNGGSERPSSGERNRSSSSRSSSSHSARSEHSSSDRQGRPERSSSDRQERTERPSGERTRTGERSGSRDGRRSSASAGDTRGGSRGGQKHRGGQSTASKPGSSKRTGSKARHAAGTTNGRPNRKARRAHLQQGTGDNS